MNELDQLDHIAAAADEGAAIADNGGQPVPVETGPDFGQEAAGMVEMVTGLLVGYAPGTAAIWTPEAKQRTAAALVPVMEKYGFSFGALPPEITLLVVAGPLLWQSSRVVAAQIEADKAKAAPPRKPQGIEGAAQMPNDRPPPQERHPQEALYKVNP